MKRPLKTYVHPLTVPGSVPNVSPYTVVMTQKDWQTMCATSEALMQLARDLIDACANGEASALQRAYWGVPEPLRVSFTSLTQKRINFDGLRFDFFITSDGPRLIEVSNNPWALLFYEGDDEHSPFEQALLSRVHAVVGEGHSVGIWPGLNAAVETDLIEKVLRRNGYDVKRITPDHLNEPVGVDALLVDLDAAWFGGTYTTVLHRAYEKWIPTPHTELMKYKSFLAYAWSCVDETVRASLLPAYLLTKHVELSLMTKDFVIKDVVGAWSRQVSIGCRSDLQGGRDGREFRRHWKRALQLQNAIVQQRAWPISLVADAPEFVAEVSCVLTPDGWQPFARLNMAGGVNTAGAGLAKVQII